MSTPLLLFLGVMLALPMIAVLETGFAPTNSDHPRRVSYAVAAVWYFAFIVLLSRRSPAAGWVYAIPQLLVGFVYAFTRFRAAPSRRR